MKTPYLWFEPEDFPSTFMGVYDHNISPDFLSYIQGKALPIRNTNPVFTFNAPRAKLLRLDVLTNSILVPLISPRVASALSKLCPDEFELIPAQINARDLPIDGYSLLNVLVKISGIDHAHSSFIMLPGGDDIMKIERLRYRRGAMGVHHLAREREYSPFLWASEMVAETFAKEKITGCSFEPPESIHP